jgi:hypothetical protein
VELPLVAMLAMEVVVEVGGDRSAVVTAIDCTPCMPRSLNAEPPDAPITAAAAEVSATITAAVAEVSVVTVGTTESADRMADRWAAQAVDRWAAQAADRSEDPAAA